MKHIIAIGLLMSCSLVLSQSIENVDFYSEGKTIVITYELNGCDEEIKGITDEAYRRDFLKPFTINVQLISSSGEIIIPKSLRGDLNNVECGTHKIIWNMYEDVTMMTGNYAVKLEAIQNKMEYPYREGSGAKDVDRNKYRTVKIGDQEWFAENLKTTKYNDGVNIPKVRDEYQWRTLSSGGSCMADEYNKNSDRLYNAYVVTNQKICPSGWHVPTLNDWKTLIEFLGGNDLAAEKLKASISWNNVKRQLFIDTIFNKDEKVLIDRVLEMHSDYLTREEAFFNMTSTFNSFSRILNQLGWYKNPFRALPNGFRNYDAEYQDFDGVWAGWWIAHPTEENGSLSVYKMKYEGSSDINFFLKTDKANLRDGYPIRCIKDK
jgi:uncharacterized protein (TIGR02145 family)